MTKNNQNTNVPDFAKSKPPQAPSWLGHCPYKVNKWGVWHHLHKHHDAYLIDFYRSPISNKMRITRQWVHATEEEIYRAGYKQAIDLVDGWEWMGAKVYAQLHNFQVCDAKL